MTDRLKGCTVVFTTDIRDEDAEALLNAIRQFRFVAAVTPSLTTTDDQMARMRLRHEMAMAIYDALNKEGDRHD